MEFHKFCLTQNLVTLSHISAFFCKIGPRNTEVNSKKLKVLFSIAHSSMRQGISFDLVCIQT